MITTFTRDSVPTDIKDTGLLVQWAVVNSVQGILPLLHPWLLSCCEVVLPLGILAHDVMPV